MVGLQVIHRLGAYFVCLVAIVSWALVRRYSKSAHMLKFSQGILALVCLQICLGIANVLLRTPALIGVLHLGTAMAILSLTVRQLHLFHLSNSAGVTSSLL
jgi:heme A synthase